MIRLSLIILVLSLTATDSRLLLRSAYDLYFFYDYNSNPSAGSHNYEQAKTLCESLGGQLPSFHSQTDIDFVLTRLVGERHKGQHIWSGLYWSDTLSSQAWLDGSDLDIFLWTTVPQFFQDAHRSDKPTDDNRWALGHYHNTGKHVLAPRHYQERVVCRMNLTDSDVCRRITTSGILQRLDPHEAKWICKSLVLPTTTTTTTTTTEPTTTTIAATTVSTRRVQWDTALSCPPCPRCCAYG